MKLYHTKSDAIRAARKEMKDPDDFIIRQMASSGKWAYFSAYSKGPQLESYRVKMRKWLHPDREPPVTHFTIEELMEVLGDVSRANAQGTLGRHRRCYPRTIIKYNHRRKVYVVTHLTKEDRIAQKFLPDGTMISIPGVIEDDPDFDDAEGRNLSVRRERKRAREDRYEEHRIENLTKIDETGEQGGNDKDYLQRFDDITLPEEEK